MANLRITLKSSSIGVLPKHKATVKALGLNKLGSVVEHQDTPLIRGMINKVNYLLKVEEV